MKKILTGDKAIEAYIQLQGSYFELPQKCGWFYVDDCDFETGYDKGSILAFDSYDGNVYEEAFSLKQHAEEWINA